MRAAIYDLQAIKAARAGAVRERRNRHMVERVARFDAPILGLLLIACAAFMALGSLLTWWLA